MGPGAFAPGSVRVSIGYADHHIIDLSSYPDDWSEDTAYETMCRVRHWDANVRSGWMPLTHGRKRMIEYDID